ncbi:hypothetical protein LDI01_21330 [Lentilactobacillus diolivorans]|uniref:Uncharacterized protein n=1 Tax=Lentilactobacillus diolivorans TaxID=179838 RepID=A0ABQ0XM90_9LACO|nr:hypothetical protein LDI01_21330 [Lentilactobacillus diolivorans]
MVGIGTITPSVLCIGWWTDAGSIDIVLSFGCIQKVDDGKESAPNTG